MTEPNILDRSSMTTEQRVARFKNPNHANANFLTYIANIENDDYEPQICGWGAFKAEVGDTAAYQTFWEFDATLPYQDRFGCDPDDSGSEDDIEVK